MSSQGAAPPPKGTRSPSSRTSAPSPRAFPRTAVPSANPRLFPVNSGFIKSTARLRQGQMFLISHSLLKSVATELSFQVLPAGARALWWGIMDHLAGAGIYFLLLLLSLKKPFINHQLLLRMMGTPHLRFHHLFQDEGCADPSSTAKIPSYP